jgi:type IV fimbrial biogenesis protein FimT
MELTVVIDTGERYTGMLIADGRRDPIQEKPNIMNSAESLGARALQLARVRADGFTLVELLTTLAVMVVLLVIGAASFSSTLQSNRLYSVQSELAASLALARSESSLRGVPVILVANVPIAGNEFGGGWTVFADANGNGALDAGEPQLRTQEALPTQITARTDGATSITFQPSGFLLPVSAITVRVCRTLSTSDRVPEYALTVQPNGMTDVSVTTCP